MQKDQKNILQFYGVYLLSIICNFIPSSNVQIFGSILFIVIFIATYIYRNGKDKQSIVYTHMGYILKSIWISSLLLIIGMIAAYLLADHNIVHQTYDNIFSGIMLTEDQLKGLMVNYLKANIYVFIITLAPSLLYFFYRLIKGMMSAQYNTPITNLKNWF